MTRFARAKGSKSSNEKLPEEATSWSEMKKAMLLKSEKVEDVSVKNILTLNKKNQVQEKPSWANLNNDSHGVSNSLLTQNGKLKQSESSGSTTSTPIKKKKQKLKKDDLSNKIESGIGKIKNVKKEKKKKMAQAPTNEEISESVEKADAKVIKKGKKRSASESNSVDISKKKKIEVDNEKISIKKKKKKGNIEQPDKVNNEKLKKSVNKKKDNLNNHTEKSQQKPIKSQNNKNNNSNFNKKYNKNFKDLKKFGREKNKFKSKKPDPAPNELIVNGEKIRLIKYQGFYVTFKDAEKLKKLRADMIKEGIPKPKLEAALKLERRRAEKALARLKKSVCFHCRGSGHLLSNCPLITENQNTSTGICYKCGSTEHTSFECKVVKDSSFQFAECFICKEQGHIARQCPDNPKGLYPHGGACKICGDVTHLKKDCPQFIEKKADEAITVNVRGERDLECLDEEVIDREKKKLNHLPKKKSTVKF